MPAVLEGAVPRPSLHLTTKVSWQPSYNPHKFSAGPTSSPAPMSPESLHSYIPHHHDSPIHSQDLGALSSSGWFAAPIPAPDHQSEASYVSYAYNQSYTTPVTSSVTFTPPAQFPKTAETVVSVANPDGSVAAYSPVSDYSRVSEHEYKHQPDESYPNPSRTTMEPSTHLLVESNHPARPRSSPSTLTHQHHASTGSIETPWAMNPLGISAPSMHEQYYHGTTYPSPRRLYAPIAPHPIGQHRASLSKRSRDDDESSEQSKRRKRSDSGANMPVELGEEDKLLIKLKDEESMPWKDIAARFQSDLGKTYQIPALQMRLKRLRERMRVWTETDVRALRMAHEYWVQSKFDIISQKMLEYGAAEKWTARQCARKWAEIDPGPTPYTTYDHHSTTSYAPYTMSPVEAPFMPYLHIQ